MALRTRVTAAFGLSAPILSAPMAGIAGGALAAAVSHSGGLGLIGGGYGDRRWLEQEFERAGDAKVGVGFISWALARDPGLLDLALERAPKAIFLSFGDVGHFASAISRAGIPLIAQVQTVKAAKIAVAEGAQVIVAQGTEAGGHGGSRATLPLVPAVVDAVPDTPVIAAGGIADGRGLAAALMLGAEGVLCGTALYATRESLADPPAKDATINASGDGTVKGTVFDLIRGHDWPQEWQLRTLDNGLHRAWHERVTTLKDNIDAVRRQYLAARASGDIDQLPVIVGEAVDLVRSLEPASAVVERIVREAEAQMRRTIETHIAP
jgi:nitronate monooxygenase